MENPRPEKVAVVAEVQQKLAATEAVILTEYRGLDVPALAELRSKLREAGGEYKVYKNSMVQFAARNLDLDIQDLLVGPTALAFVTDRPDGTPGDAVLVAKALSEFAKDHDELVVKGGLMGESLLTPEDAAALAKVLPREELLARFAGGLAAPMQRMAGLIAALPRNFAYALSALVEKGGGVDAPAEDAAPAEADAAPVDETSVDETPEAVADAPAEDTPEDAVADAPAEDAPETETEES